VLDRSLDAGRSLDAELTQAELSRDSAAGVMGCDGAAAAVDMARRETLRASSSRRRLSSSSRCNCTDDEAERALAAGD